MNDLRRSIIETFLSIIHGMQQSAYKGIIMADAYKLRCGYLELHRFAAK